MLRLPEKIDSADCSQLSNWVKCANWIGLSTCACAKGLDQGLNCAIRLAAHVFHRPARVQVGQMPIKFGPPRHALVHQPSAIFGRQLRVLVVERYCEFRQRPLPLAPH